MHVVGDGTIIAQEVALGHRKAVEAKTPNGVSYSFHIDGVAFDVRGTGSPSRGRSAVRGIIGILTRKQGHASPGRAVTMLATLLAEAYGIGTPEISPMTKGTVNRNYLVLASDGGAWVLKHYATSCAREEALRSCEVQVRLREAGVPAPEVRLNRHGDLITQTSDGCFMVSAFVSGRQYDRGQIPPKAAYAMGQTLGRLHGALAGEEHRYEFPGRDDVLKRLTDLLTRAKAKRGESPVDQEACRILEAKIEALAVWGEPPGPTSAQWVHGDYQETNLIFDSEDQVAAVIDFDNLRIRPRGAEVMRALAYSFDAGNGLAEAAYAFFAGYVQTSGVQADEVARWASDWTYTTLTNDWPIAARYLEPQTYDPRWDRFILYRPSWWLGHRPAVAERLLHVVSESK